MTAAPVVSTYSMWSLFRNCRKAVDWRYQQRLVPLQRDRNLHFGSLIHECLQVWHQRRDLDEVLALIDKLCPNHLQDDNQRRDWHLAIAMMKAYAVQYASWFASGVLRPFIQSIARTPVSSTGSFSA